MNIIETIFDIEDKDTIIDKDWYYHGFYYNGDKFRDMIKHGIKAKVLRKDFDTYGDNGNFYISLSKDLDFNVRSSYHLYYNYPRFIIDSGVKTVKASTSKSYPEIFVNSPFPFRESEYLDEYQAFLKINSNKIIGISYNLFDSYEKEIFSIEDLKNLKDMIIIMNEENIFLPIIDNGTKLQMNKEKILELKL